MASPRLLVATHNPGKLREFEFLLAPHGIAVVGAAALGLAEPEETGTSFAANALLKAQAAAEATGLVALADDSGLAVDGLDGAQRDFEHAIARVLDALAARHGSFAAAPKGASFVAVLCLCRPDGAHRLFEGRSTGELIAAPRGARGFGYDPIFVPEGERLSFAEMTAEEKHAISHRRRALDAFLASLAASGNDLARTAESRHTPAPSGP